MKIQLAGCVIVDAYDRILLLHRSGNGVSQWELPGGKLEQDESAEAAAIREIREELDVPVLLTRNLGSGEFADDENEYVYTWFQAHVVAGEPTIAEADKFDDLDYFDFEDLMSLALSANMQVLLEKMVSGEVVLEDAKAV